MADRGARRVPVTRVGVAPCRVSLADARPGQSVILLNYPHLDDPASPFRASGPIYVSESARDHAPDVDHVPAMLATRLLSARVYDGSNMMIDADVMEGETLAGRLANWFADPEVRHVHLHARAWLLSGQGRARLTLPSCPLFRPDAAERRGNSMTIFGANEIADRGPDDRSLGWTRLVIGLIQGAALLGLYLSLETGHGPPPSPACSRRWC
ncbi:DUF1203 domain-containing protein [Brevundimonas denitrificans]|uniref:DUF1203 domain-containing protein n=1 Tax=Brevundimonas denitrificans TaxID=1443434 RepID=UPI00223C0D24|nr:DUF1203 domain-containing protein [Brevundimonas denitrificans]